MKAMFLIAAMTCVSLSVIGQERADHELVKEGEPAPGMSVQQQEESVDATVREEDVEETTRVPLIQESTLDDEDLDSWRAGEMFRNDQVTEKTFDKGTTRLDTVRRVMNPIRSGTKKSSAVAP